MKLVISTAHLWLIVAALLLMSSVGYLSYLVLSMRPQPQTESTSLQVGAQADTPIPEAPAQMNCPEPAWVQQQIMREVPAIYLEGLGKDNKILPTSEIISCITIPACNNTVSCTEQKFSFNESCIASAIAQKKLFSQTFDKMKDTLPNGNAVSVVVRNEDYVLDTPLLAKVTAQLLGTRLNYCSLNAGQFKNEKLFVPIPVTVSDPNTDGTVSKKYIEVDGSRQLMWLWENGKVTKRYQTSGAFAEYNPVGVHTILNKSRKAWSSTAKKWMPYWMAFTYDKKQKTWFGVHALVYWFPDFQQTGEYVIKEPESNIGKPRSTGCIRLSHDDAEKVFNWTNVGDMVVVHD